MRLVAPSGHVVDTGAKLQLKIESAKGNREKNINETLHGPFMHITCSAAGKNEKELSATLHVMRMNQTRMTHIIFLNHSCPFMDIICSAAGRNEKVLSATLHEYT